MFKPTSLILSILTVVTVGYPDRAVTGADLSTTKIVQSRADVLYARITVNPDSRRQEEEWQRQEEERQRWEREQRIEKNRQGWYDNRQDWHENRKRWQKEQKRWHREEHWHKHHRHGD